MVKEAMRWLSIETWIITRFIRERISLIRCQLKGHTYEGEQSGLTLTRDCNFRRGTYTQCNHCGTLLYLRPFEDNGERSIRILHGNMHNRPIVEEQQ